MRLLGIIRKIDGKPRTWERPEGGTVYTFTMVFDAEGNQFRGEYTINPNYLAQIGLRPGAVGYLDIKFSLRDIIRKTTGEAFTIQEIKFSKWSLANGNYQAEQPATEQPQEAAPAAPVAPAAEAPVEGEINPETGLPF